MKHELKIMFTITWLLLITNRKPYPKPPNPPLPSTYDDPKGQTGNPIETIIAAIARLALYICIQEMVPLAGLLSTILADLPISAERPLVN